VALRLIRAYLTADRAKEVRELPGDVQVLDSWQTSVSEKLTATDILVVTEKAEAVIDALEKRFSHVEGFRVMILPVEGTVPRQEEPPKEQEEEQETKKPPPQRISIEELYQKMAKVARFNKGYMVMVSLAAVIAAIGLTKNDVAIVIGSMVIAPLLNPNMALSFSTTLADFQLMKKSLLAMGTGFVIALGIGILTGAALEVDPAIPQIALRSDIHHYYILLALATGVAGAYSITTGVSEALVGVMVSVALLPPLVATGLLLGAGHVSAAGGAVLLFLVNLVSINLSGIVTFLIQGIRPKRWWEAKKAARAVRLAVILWVSLLVMLALLIFIADR
jgi:uncharacterized hydrophobic protein (TIGR00341 family)